MGTGQSDGSLCLTFCDEWLLACQREFFDPYIEASEGVPFCREDSLICSPILDVVNSSRGFCEHMGFKVLSPSEQEIDEENSTPSKRCFNGIPRQLAEKGKLMRTDQQRRENYSQDYKAYIQQELQV